MRQLGAKKLGFVHLAQFAKTNITELPAQFESNRSEEL